MSSRQRPLLLAALALVALTATAPGASAAQVAACTPGTSAVALSSHALAQPFTVATAKDLTGFQVWLSGTGTAHVAVEPFTVPADASLPVPDDGHRIIETDLAVATGSPEPIGFTPELPQRLVAGTYAIVVDPPVGGSIAWAACGTSGGFMRDDELNWGPVPASFAIGVDANEADLTPPAAHLVDGPPARVAAGDLDLVVAADELVHFSCALDDANVPCGSARFATSGTLTLLDLTEGTHTVSVQATDVMGNTQTVPDSATFVVDATPPVTTATVDAPRGGSHDAVLHLGANEAATFSCSLDGGTPAGCADGDVLTLDGEGVHALRAFATDLVGNVEDPGATVSFLADWTAPTLTVPGDLQATAETTDGVVLTFAVSASDDLDPAPVASCDPATGSRFPVGDSAVRCTAIDASGNEAQAGFAVHVAPPPIGAAEIDVSADPDSCALVIGETHGGTIERPDAGTIIARVAGHETDATLSAARSREGDDGPRGAYLRIRSFVYDGFAAPASRNGYGCRIRSRHDGSVRRVVLTAFGANGAVIVRYLPDRGTSIVTRLDAAGTLIDVKRVDGAVVPHLQTDAGTVTVS